MYYVASVSILKNDTAGRMYEIEYDAANAQNWQHALQMVEIKINVVYLILEVLAWGNTDTVKKG